LLIALIADIHGNAVALERVLSELEHERPDRVVCLGDVASTGPQPREAIALLRATGCPVVLGNADEWLLTPQFSPNPDEATAKIEEIDAWCREQLGPEHLDYLRGFRSTIEIPLDKRTVLLCCHGSPRSNTEAMRSATPDSELGAMLDRVRATILTCGHTHEQLLRRFGELILLNPGSVGLPFQGDRQTGTVRNPAWAEYALIRWQSGALGIELRRVPVDARTVIAAALVSGMPHAEWWAADWETL